VSGYFAILDVTRELWTSPDRCAPNARSAVSAKGSTPTSHRQGLFVPAWFRDRPDVERLGSGFGLSRATAHPFQDEGIAVPVSQLPDLHEALEPANDSR
jgi:hypothetical protein